MPRRSYGSEETGHVEDPSVCLYLERQVWTHLPGLHLLRPPSEGHVGVVIGGAVSFLLFDLSDQRRPPTVLPLPHPVVVHGLQQVVVLVQQQLRLRQGHQLKPEPEPEAEGSVEDWSESGPRYTDTYLLCAGLLQSVHHGLKLQRSDLHLPVQPVEQSLVL